MQGELQLRISADRRNRSFISRMKYEFPMKVLRPFYLDRIGTVFIYMMDTAGGILKGDKLETDIRVDDGAKLYATNASTTKSYPMPEGRAFVDQRFSVGKQACLEFFPEAIVLFQDTDLVSTTRIASDASGAFAFCELYGSGRKHAGEQFRFRRFANETEIRIGGKLAIWEKYGLEGERLRFGQPGILEAYTHWGTMYVYHQGAGSELLDGARHCLEAFGRDASVWAGCSLHPSGVVVVKALAYEYDPLKACLHSVWSQLRKIVLKEEMPYIRK